MEQNIYERMILEIEEWPKRLKKATMTQKELSKLAGISDITISKIINFKEKNPKIKTLDAIEKVFESKGV